jgi:two-component system nitrogen regulation response regulator GlnG
MILDDDPGLLLDQVKHLFEPRGVKIDVCLSGGEGVRRIAKDQPSVVLLDVRLPDFTGLEVYQQIRRIDARIPVIFITASTTADTAIEAMKQGAHDYLFKPVDLEKLDSAVSWALELSRLMSAPPIALETPPDDDRAAIIGRCPPMLEVYKAIGRVANQNVTVLITGESGTGKELVARAIYQHSMRAKAPFLAINCAAIPESLLESELFGHEKGAFTGADRRRIGKFEQCNGGTLMLDEIGDMPLATQGKILRLLEAQQFERVGGNETISTDVRLIAATNRDLADATRFRPELFYRLSVFTIQLPPLRERGDDLSVLIGFFLRRCSKELGREVREIAPEAVEVLRNYRWPGNVRELQSVLKQSLLRSSGNVLMPAALPEALMEAVQGVGSGQTVRRARSEVGSPATGQQVSEQGNGAGRGAGTEAFGGSAPGVESFEEFIRRRLEAGATDLHAEAHLQFDRVLLPMVLRHTEGSQQQAAKVLGIARQTLRARLRELDLSVTRSVENGHVAKDVDKQ